MANIELPLPAVATTGSVNTLPTSVPGGSQGPASERSFSALVNASLAAATGPADRLAGDTSLEAVLSASVDAGVSTTVLDDSPDISAVETGEVTSAGIESSPGEPSVTDMLDLLNGSLPGSGDSIEHGGPATSATADNLLKQVKSTASNPSLPTVTEIAAKWDRLVKEVAANMENFTSKILPGEQSEEAREQPSTPDESGTEDNTDLPFSPVANAMLVSMVAAPQFIQSERQSIPAYAFPDTDTSHAEVNVTVSGSRSVNNMLETLNSDGEPGLDQTLPLPGNSHGSFAGLLVEPFAAEHGVSSTLAFGKALNALTIDSPNQWEPTPMGIMPAATMQPPQGLSASDIKPEQAMPPTLQAPLEVTRKGWGEALGQHLIWMVQNHHQHAELKVNPPQLGPLEIHLSLDHAHTSVAFFSHEASVREALETALPRLKEMLDSQGIQLQQAHVSDQSLPHRQGSDNRPANPWVWNGERVERPADELDAEQVPIRTIGIGIVDHYI